jgi:hypothetical protein
MSKNFYHAIFYLSVVVLTASFNVAKTQNEVSKGADISATEMPVRPDPTPPAEASLIFRDKIIQPPEVDKGSIPRPTKTASVSVSGRGSLSLCYRLAQLKNIPYDSSKPAGDPVYDELIAAGKQAIPCLIDKITDTSIIPDPREGDPVITDFRVGDAAVFMLMIITGVEAHPEKMLPPRYAKLWKEEGIYSYFSYVEKPSNRRQLQVWWRNWVKNSR